MIELAFGIIVAIIIVLVAFVAFAYGLKCGLEMRQIPPLVEPKTTTREEDVVGNPFD